MFSAPSWLRDLGFASWLLVGFVLVIVGLVWLLTAGTLWLVALGHEAYR